MVAEPKATDLKAEAVEETVEPISPWNLEVLAAKWPAVVESLAEAKRSLWAALSDTLPVAVDDDVLTIGFAKRQDAEILRKPQGPGSPLPNADLLRDAIYQHTGHRVRFTVGELPEGAVAASSESSWPVVTSPGSDASEDASGPESEAHTEPDAQPEPESSEAVVSTDGEETAEAVESTDTPANGSVLGQRGEPAIRTILGGELIAEEVLDADSPGDSDV